VFFVYNKKRKDGFDTEDTMNKISGDNTDDPCEYNLKVEGLLQPVVFELFGVNILQPIDDIINIINDIIIYVDFFVNKFIGCLLLYILDAFGLVLWGIMYVILSIINMQSILDTTYEYIDKNVDANVYYYTGMHLIHFPTLYQNRCYRIDGKDRIQCWQSPYGNNNKNTEGITTVKNNTGQNMSFYELLIILLLILAILLILSIVFFWIKSFFPPTIQCGEGKACEA
jgi:hypothetical protein